MQRSKISNTTWNKNCSELGTGFTEIFITALKFIVLHPNFTVPQTRIK